MTIPTNAVLATDIENLKGYLGGVEERNASEHNVFRDDIKQIKNRLPVWATGLIALLTLIIGVLARGIQW